MHPYNFLPLHLLLTYSKPLHKLTFRMSISSHQINSQLSLKLHFMCFLIPSKRTLSNLTQRFAPKCPQILWTNSREAITVTKNIHFPSTPPVTWQWSFQNILYQFTGLTLKTTMPISPKTLIIELNGINTVCLSLMYLHMQVRMCWQMYIYRTLQNIRLCISF